MKLIDIKTKYAEWYKSKNALAFTVCANQDYNKSCFISKLRNWHCEIDRRRLGGRYYQKPAEARLDFYVVPEGFDAANPHYHGFLVPPADDFARLGGDGLSSEYVKAWRLYAPAGTIDLSSMHDVSGWAQYASKTSSLATSDDAIWSLASFLPSPG